MIIKKADRIADISSYYFASKLQEVAQMNADGGSPVINLGIGSPDLSPPPSVIAAMNDHVGTVGANKYQSYKGISELRTAFAEWYSLWFGVSLSPDSNILPLIGSKEGIMHICMSFLQEGDSALVPNPGYPAYQTCTRISGATPIPYTLSAEDNWLPDLDHIASTSDLSKVKIMWINYPHMPTGAKATKAFYEKLIPWAKEHQILICSDNPYTFILNDTHISPLQIEGASEVCIELVSLSKAYNMAGFRVGALVGNENYINTVLTFKSNMDSGAYKPIQLAAVAALLESEAWFSDLNTEYKKRRALVYQIMNVLDLEYAEDTAGLFVWGRLPHDLQTSAEVIDDILQGARVFLTPGHIFGSAGEGYIRVSLCNTQENIKAALDRIMNHLKLMA